MASDSTNETPPEDITDTYDIGETLGTGHFSKVKLGIHKETGMKVAIKVISVPVSRLQPARGGLVLVHQQNGWGSL
eukprot:scaffold221979_cov33-Tisochrysis_lutea.AAC.5